MRRTQSRDSKAQKALLLASDFLGRIKRFKNIEEQEEGRRTTDYYKINKLNTLGSPRSDTSDVNDENVFSEIQPYMSRKEKSSKLIFNLSFYGCCHCIFQI